MLFDSHAHLDDEAFENDRYKIIENLKKDGVDEFINVASSIKTSAFSLSLAEKYPFIHASVGVHPSECGKMTEADFIQIEKWLSHKKCVALGEIGLDYHYDELKKTFKDIGSPDNANLRKNLTSP